MSRQYTAEERAEIGARLKAARLAKRGEAVARTRGRKARDKVSFTKADQRAREKEAAALLRINSEPKPRRRKSRRPKAGVFAFILGGNRSRSASKTSRRRTMARGRKGNKAQGNQSYANVTSQFPVQVAIEAAEALFTLGSVAVDIYTASTQSTADDTAFPVVVRVIQSGARYASQRFLSRRHPGLAAAIAHGMSAANGDRNGNFIRNRVRRLLQPTSGAQK